MADRFDHVGLTTAGFGLVGVDLAVGCGVVVAGVTTGELLTGVGDTVLATPATEMDTSAWLTAGSRLDAVASVLAGAPETIASGAADLARELLPMVMTAPTNTPTVMLKADAVSAMPVPRRTTPSASIAPSVFTLAHGYRFAVPRRSHRPGRRADPTPITGWQNSQSTSDGEFLVQTVPGAASSKSYRCPGCQQLIAPGTPHLVVWPAWTGGADAGVERRRHWHRSCWNRRASRGGPGQLAW